MQRGAAASLHAALAERRRRTPSALRRALRKSRRREQLRAAALVLPLFVFLAACFVVPIGAMLSRGVIDTDIARILPDVTAALKSWDGRDLPPESAYAALIADIRAAREAGTLASAATRLNYDVPGFRTLLFATGAAAARRACGIRARGADRHRSRSGASARPGPRSAAPAVPSPTSTCWARSICGATPTARSSARRPSSGCFATCSGARCGSRRW